MSEQECEGSGCLSLSLYYRPLLLRSYRADIPCYAAEFFYLQYQYDKFCQDYCYIIFPPTYVLKGFYNY